MQFRVSPLPFLISPIMILIISSCAFNHYKTDKALYKNEIETAIKKSAYYLRQNVRSDGKFNYKLNMNPDVKVKEGYNILRHAGTIYSMTQYYRLFQDDEILNSIHIAGRYLQSMISPLPGHDNILAVWSRPQVNKANNPVQAKLGGAGLGLVALLNIENITPGFTSENNLRNLGNFIVYMQKEDGSFYSKYIPDKGGLVDDWHSIYYPGEAALGLLFLNDIYPSLKWSKSAIKALEYLALKSKISEPVVDHWTLLATDKLFKSPNINPDDYNVNLLMKHAIQICQLIINEQITGDIKNQFAGGFTRDGRTTPTSTRLEGLLAALNFMPVGYSALREEIKSAVDNGIHFLINSQVKEGPFAGAFPRSVATFPLTTPVARSYNRRATEVRIDYVQHALSAMIQFYTQAFQD